MLVVENSETDGSVTPRLEPVERVRRNDVLIARTKLDLVPDRERAVLGIGRTTGRVRRRIALGVEVDHTAPTAKGLLLAWGVARGRVPMLGHV